MVEKTPPQEEARKSGVVFQRPVNDYNLIHPTANSTAFNIGADFENSSGRVRDLNTLLRVWISNYCGTSETKTIFTMPDGKTITMIKGLDYYFFAPVIGLQWAVEINYYIEDTTCFDIQVYDTSVEEPGISTRQYAYSE